MAGMERFAGRELPPGKEGSFQWPEQYMEGDPRRPTTLSRPAGLIKSSRSSGYQQEPGEAVMGGESDKYAGLGIGVSGLIAENLACHPFVILRRQCQVNVEGRRYHTTPFTILPVLVNLNRWQGVAVLWKGIGSTLTIKGMTLGIEDCLSKVTPWPKEVDQHSSLKMIGQHILLKATSTALITPFYSASLVETVQSDIASEKPGILDVFKEGIGRLLSWSDPRCGRMLPVWVLVPPQVIHSVCHYFISTVFQGVWLQVLKATHRECEKLKGAVSKDPQLSNLPGLSQYQSQAAALTGHLVADCVLYPLETVLHRLHLQGTRSIIDNLDSGREVVPILTRYEGISDCFSTIVQEEGVSGLFKGFGAVMLQYALHFLIIKFSSKLITQIAQLFADPRLGFTDPRVMGGTTFTPQDDVTVGGDPSSAATSVRGSPRPRAQSGVGDGQVSQEEIVTNQRVLRTQETAVLTNSPEIVNGNRQSVGLPDVALFSMSRSGDADPTLQDDGMSTQRAPGLPSLLSFSSSSTSSQQRRILPDRDFDHYNNKSWRSLDNL